MEERRRYYRVNDKVSLNYKILENNELDREMYHASIGYIKHADLRNASRCIDARLEAISQNLAKDNPLVAEAISLITRKFSILEMLAGEGYESTVSEYSEQEVNLSGSGIAFFSDTPLMEDTPLKIQLVVYPENQFVSTIARVVNCKEINNENGKYFVAVDFEGISEEDREHIIQHILKKQTEELKNSRQTIKESAT